MKVSHIIYKVNNLQKAVKKLQNKGFIVEYGKEKKPYNALIYFSDSPYIELMASSGMPSLMKTILRFAGKNRFVYRLDYWDNYKSGICGVALESDKFNLDKEIAILKKYGQGYFLMKSGRNDIKGRKLRFTCLFPDELQIPFMHTRFNIDPKPNNFVHPNGIKGIKSISFGTTETNLPIIKELCDDPILNLFIGNEIKDMEFNR